MIARTLLAAYLMAQSGDVAPLDVEPPIGGILWSIVIPALLLAVSTLATYGLYRHFAGKPAGSD
jgi:hypothetical protein